MKGRERRRRGNGLGWKSTSQSIMSANQPEQSTSASIPSAEDVESEGTEDANGAQRQMQPIDRLPIFSCMAAHTTARMPSRPLLLEGWSSNHENPRLEPDS
jgi:hypothetical protein